MTQQHLLHLMGCLVFHYLEVEIRGCPTLQQIQFSQLCFWSPPEKAQSKLPPPKVQGVSKEKNHISWRGLANFLLTSCAAEVFGTCHATHHALWAGKKRTAQQMGIHPQIHPAGQVLFSRLRSSQKRILMHRTGRPEAQGRSIEVCFFLVRWWKNQKPQIYKNCVKPFTAPKTCSTSNRQEKKCHENTSLSPRRKRRGCQLLGTDLGQPIWAKTVLNPQGDLVNTLSSFLIARTTHFVTAGTHPSMFEDPQSIPEK